MASYKIACVSMDYDADVQDCRCITEIGFFTEKRTITTRTPEQVYEMVEEDGHTVVVEYRGEQIAVEGVTKDGKKYVRSAETDTAEDTLMKKPGC